MSIILEDGTEYVELEVAPAIPAQIIRITREELESKVAILTVEKKRLELRHREEMDDVLNRLKSAEELLKEFN